MISKNIIFLSVRLDFILATNSADSDEMPHLCGISSASSLSANVPALEFPVFIGSQLVYRGLVDIS